MINEPTEHRYQSRTVINKLYISRYLHQPHWRDATFCTCEVKCEFQLFPKAKEV